MTYTKLIDFISIACERGRYGDGCKENCGQCNDVDQCSTNNGTCLTGCNVGVKGDSCKTGKCENELTILSNKWVFGSSQLLGRA